MKLGIVILAFVVLAGWQTVTAQDDIPIIQYDEEYTYRLARGGDQYFVQFDGQAGDVVFLSAETEENVDFMLDMWDSLGQSIGIRRMHAREPFVVAEIPSDGRYFVVITPSARTIISFMVARSGYLSDGAEVIVRRGGLLQAYLLHPEQTGRYQIILNVVSGDTSMGLDFDLWQVREPGFELRLSILSDEILESSTSVVWLEANETYVGFFSPPILTTPSESITLFAQVMPLE